MRYIAIVWAFFVVHSTFAATESTSTTKIENVTEKKKFEEDKKITDLELRAASGSMSRLSMKAELGYTGPAINALYDQDRPNPNNSPGDFRTFMSGAVGLRYRLSTQNTLNFGAGLTWYNPVETVTGKPVKKARGSADDVSVSSPRISYDHSYVFRDIQMRNNIKATWTTDSQYVKVGQAAGLSVSHNMKYQIGQSRLTVGFESAPAFYYYNREYLKKDRNTSNYGVGFYPNASYRLLGSLDATTSLGYFFKNLRKEGTWFNWKQDKITGRFGLGWSVTKEIYINPYINMFPQDPDINTTTFAVGTVVSIF